MPLLKLQVSVPIPENKRDAILAASSKILSKVTGKPEAYVMVMIEESAGAFMAGKKAAAAFVDVRGIGGLNAKVNAQLSKDLCELCQKELGISPENVYLNFFEVPATNWGWKGSTFG